jgi:nitrile hydratase subunit beta
VDGIHDLGGRQGFGSVAVDEPDEAFHAPWEARLFGIVRSMSRAPDWSIDWFRHCRELIDPVDYLTRPYYDQWLQTYAAMLINSGVATVEELASGRSRGAAPALPAPLPPDAVAAEKKLSFRYNRETTAVPRFKMGAAVRAKSWANPGHTRLPQYVRGHRGRVTACHGAHVFPDANAHGEARAETLYTVEFDAADLWPEASARHHRVCVDLWESYLEPL